MKTSSMLVGVLVLMVTRGVPAADVQLLGVRENVAQQYTAAQMQERYRGFAEFISQVTGTQTRVEAAQDSRSLEGLKKGRYSYMFVRPGGLTAMALQDHGYSLVAVAKDQVNAAFIAKKGTALSKPQDMVAKRIALPDRSSFIGKLALLSLRDMGLDPAKLNIQNARFQDSVEYIVEQNLADVGVVAEVVAKTWEQKGGVVLFRGKPVPSWSVIAAPKVSPGEVAKVRAALIAMEGTESGKKTLAQMGVSGFKEGNSQAYIELYRSL